MMSAELKAQDPNHERCAQEPVHFIGRIQPYGVFLALSEPDFVVRHVSDNVAQFLGLTIEETLDKSFENAIGTVQFEFFRSSCEALDVGPPVVSQVISPPCGLSIEMDCLMHRRDGLLFVELEPRRGSHTIGPINVDAHIRIPLSRMEKATSIVELCQFAATEIRRLTGFDRVMIYRFDEEWAGEVIAEVAEASADSYLGLHFPSSDIPPQVRPLFLVNPLRTIVDANAAAASIIPGFHPGTGQPLDLTYSVLRSAASVHLEYLRNMGVAASMTVSIIVEGRLWGMIACHHTSSYRVDGSTRSVCQLIGQALASQISLRMDNLDLQASLKSRNMLTSYIAGIEECKSLPEAIDLQRANLLAMFDADGIVTSLGGCTSCWGTTIDPEFLVPLSNGLERLSIGGVASSHQLREIVPDSPDGAGIAGALYIRLAAPDDYLIFFLKELIETVHWAGDPHNTVIVDEQDQLHPRASFATWSKTVRGQSRNWTQIEIERASNLRDQFLRLNNLQQLAMANRLLDHEITERRETEMRLAESKSQLQAVFDNMSEGVLVIDRDGRIVLRNKAALRLLSITEKSENYREVSEQFEAFLPNGDRLQPDDWPNAMALRGQFVQNFEILYRHKLTGESGAREISSAPVKRLSGEAGLIIMNYRDITQRRQIDEARTRLAAIVESSEDAIISKDTEGIITSWNLGAEKLFGYTEAEMIGHSVARLLPEEGLQEEDEILRRINLGEIVEHYETVRKKKNGQFIHVSLTISPIRDASGRLIGASKIARNISERKLLESQLMQAQKMEAVGQLAAGIAHEINTPIQYVGDNTNFFRESWSNVASLMDAAKELRNGVTPGMVPQATLDAFDRCSKAADVEYLSKDIPRAIDETLEGVGRVARIVSAMKEFSHPGSQEKVAVDLNRAIETTITISRHEWKYVAEVKTQLDPNLPLVPCLAGEINQVLLNIVVNASQAIADSLPADGSTLGTITLSTRHDQSFVEVSIADTGIGIPEHLKERVFDPFFTTKEVGKGTGQGLTLAHSVVVKKHGGQIWFDSELGKGTTFFIRLPLSVECEN